MNRMEAWADPSPPPSDATAFPDCPRRQLRNSRTHRKEKRQTQFQSPSPLIDSVLEKGRLQPKPLPLLAAANPNNPEDDCLRNKLPHSRNLFQPNADDPPKPSVPGASDISLRSVPREIYTTMTDVPDDGTEITLDPALPGTFCHPWNAGFVVQERVGQHVHDDIEYRPSPCNGGEGAKDFVPPQVTFGKGIDGSLWKQVSELGFEER